MNGSRPYLSVLPFFWAVMAAVFFIVLPHVEVDRVSESGAHYLELPYRLIEQKNIVVRFADPFPENGPQAVYPPAAIVYFTGSLLLMRSYLFMFSMVVLGMLTFLFFRTFRRHVFTVRETAAYGIIFLATWISIPLALVYPIQVNGITAGFACLLLGVLIYPKSPTWGMFCFGWAYAFKGQYLALLPGFMVYLYFVDIRSKNLGVHFLKATGALLMFFVPKTIILGGLCLMLGMFETDDEFYRYAFDAYYLIHEQVAYVAARLMGHASGAAPEKAVRRTLEYAGFGFITWAHVVFSAFFCLFYSLKSIWNRIRTPLGQEVRLDSGLSVFAWGGLAYWINYLFFYRYPYWYNVFAVIFMNIFLSAACAYLAAEWLTVKYSKRWGNLFLMAGAVGALFFFCNRVKRECLKPSGNALTPYEWMRKS